MSDWVKTSYEKRLLIMHKKLLDVKNLINISVDAWKGDNKHNYLAICSHFIYGGGKQSRMLLGFPRILGSKTGENEANLIAKVLTTFGIDCTRLRAFMADNATDNNASIRHIETLLGMPEGWAKRNRIRCMGHIINLIVEDLLFGDHEQSKHSTTLAAVGDEEQYDVWIKLGLIGRVHNICIWLNRSPERREGFENLQKAMQLTTFLALLVNGGIRCTR